MTKMVTIYNIILLSSSQWQCLTPDSVICNIQVNGTTVLYLSLCEFLCNHFIHRFYNIVTFLQDKSQMENLKLLHWQSTQTISLKEVRMSNMDMQI